MPYTPPQPLQSSASRVSALVATALALVLSQATAQEYPNKSIRLVVPFSPGGPADLLGRVIGDKIGRGLGQTVVVINKDGAGTILGADMVAKATPDGYTLFLGNLAMVVNSSSGKKLPYDLLKDLAPVSVVFKQSQILVVTPSLPANSLKELIAIAKASPGKLKYGTSGVGSAIHLHSELLRMAMGVTMTHVPYKGQAPAMADLFSGQIDMIFSGISPIVPFLKTGKLRAIGVSTPQRMPVIPDVPTLMEGGLANFSTAGWYGILVPSGTPKAIITRLNTEIVKAMSAPEVVERLGTQGGETTSTTPEAFSALIREELKTWTGVIKEANIRLE